jgi:DNA-binding protein
MYVKNIDVEERSNEDICKDVRSYGRMVGLRIMTVEIVRNRYCEDVVGCRIRIPWEQVEKAVSIETWPNDVSCRKWGNRSNKEHSNRYNYGNQDY